jgi:hypothetical protein
MPSAKNDDTKVTDDVKKFLKKLKPGDVLLFDTITLVSQLIKFAENRPVNHCGVFLGDDTFAQVGSGTAHAHTADLRERLEKRPGPLDRTVTALRHVDAFDAKASVRISNSIVKIADEYINVRKTDYSFVSLRHLMIPSLYRNYRNDLENTKHVAKFLPLISSLAKAILSHFGQVESVSKLDGTKSLTCSEFVYRCYLEAAPRLQVDVHRPLMTWDMELLRWSQPKLLSRSKGGDGGSDQAFHELDAFTVVRQENDFYRPLLFDDSIKPDLLMVSIDEIPSNELRFVSSPRGDVDALTGDAAAMWGGGGRPLSQGSGEVDLSEWSDGMFHDVARRNARYEKYKDEAQPAFQAGEVFADAVTPRDLWSSRSLRPVAVFHCPPSRDDEPILE